MTQEELNDLKEEIKALNKKLAELTDEEFAQVTGGAENNSFDVCPKCGKTFMCGEHHSCTRIPIVT